MSKSQGGIIGVIVPPPDIRAVVDKTAQFVAKNGKSFEERIMNSEEGMTPKFSFLKSFDPYHGYYEQKIREAEDVASGKAAPKNESIPAAPVKVPVVVQSHTAEKVTFAAQASLITPLARIAQTIVDEAPPPLEFTLVQPIGISNQDLDIIKLTAQYTAVNGRDFLANIAQREQRNPQFEFLVPTSVNFNFFTTLVDQYIQVLERNKTARTTLQQALQKKQHRMQVLEQSVLRWKWGHQEEEKQRAQRQGGDSEVSDTFLIDWAHFTIVETISFSDDFLVPNTAHPLAFSAPSSGGSGKGSAEASTGADDEDKLENDLDDEIYDDDDDGEDMDTDNDDQEDEEDDAIHVVDNYKPTLSNASLAQQTMKDPISGKTIDVNAIGEHMRVQLIDPRWRAEQQKFIDKQKETGYAAGDTISQNLQRFAKHRTDIFGEESAGSEPNKPVIMAPITNPAKRKKL